MNTMPSSAPFLGASAAPGTLVVLKENPRYFTVASGDAADRRAVYLTGSHIWNNLHDGMGPGSDCTDTPEPSDYDAYLAFLTERGHNLIRLWRWEQFKSQAAGGTYHLCMSPQPWPRTGPGTAKDGRPKFDLSRFDQAYFDRLRERVIAAGSAGIYVAVMLFEGWGLHLSPPPDNVEGHPFHAANNVNEIGIASIVDYQVLPLDPRIRALQEAYIHKVVDTVHDLPNVLYEVANESSGGGTVEKAFAQMLGMEDPPDWGDSTRWQYWVIDVVKRCERERGYDAHPIGMTMQFPVPDQARVNEPLFNSAADWISPGFDDEIFTGRWLTDPPANDGRKVVISDTDHYAPGLVDAVWAWKSFLRGHHPILMDFGIIDGVNPAEPGVEGPGVPSFNSFEPVRYAMGDTRRYAERMQLAGMQPRGDLSSTGYVLASPGREYLVLQPSETGGPFALTLEAGAYTVEWYNVSSRVTMTDGTVTLERDGSSTFTAPFAQPGPTVLYLKQVGD